MPTIRTLMFVVSWFAHGSPHLDYCSSRAEAERTVVQLKLSGEATDIRVDSF